MKHYIIAKFRDGIDWKPYVKPVRELFEETLRIDGISSVNVYPSCSDRSNRYDIMIEIDMEREALPLYDVSEAHQRWKREYSDLLAGKTIFDRE